MWRIIQDRSCVMRGLNGKRIVNTSYASAHAGDRIRAAYQTSKAGINALTRHIASRWGKQGIRCNSVSPGLVVPQSAQKTAQNAETMAMARQAMPSTRFGKPEDLAGVAAFLLSDDGEWINGQVWSVNGGAMLRE
jgi:NAD(P)-dependent dehydrogenase (short-subunit alcohol dehydrogenase family)